MRIKQSQFCFRPGPLESSVRQPLVQQDISVSAPVQRFNPVGSSAAEQEQTFLIQMPAELLSHNRSQTVNTQSEICIAAGHVVVANLAQIDHSD